MSENTKPYLSPFNPVSYFFTEKDKLTQSPAQVFGPADPDDENLFRLTSSFSVSGEAMAYAICSGPVLIQPQESDTNRVNLILRPYKQPILGLPIKYFIYRGLKRSDFFQGEQITTTSQSDLIQKMWKDFQAFHGDSIPSFLAKYIGFNPNQSPDLPLYGFFFKDSLLVENGSGFLENDPFELPMAQEGFSLGHFTGSDCGIEVVLDYGDYQLPPDSEEFTFDLNFARAKETLIDLRGETNEYLRKLKKEQITQFLDIAAYYGFHTENGMVKTKENDWKRSDIYTQFVSRFFSKNRIYLYIQSDRGRSYNFYENYSISETNPSCLKVGTSETNLQETTFGTQGWPVLITSQTEENGQLYLQLTTDNNPQTLLYGQIAQIESTSRNNFVDIKNLTKIADEFNNLDDFTQSIVLSIPNNNETPIATFNILQYHGKKYKIISSHFIDEDDISSTQFRTVNFSDDLFDLIEALPLWKLSSTNNITTVNNNKLKISANTYLNQQENISVSQSIKIEDKIKNDNITINRVTYIIQPQDSFNDSLTLSPIISSNSKTSESKLLKGTETYHPSEPFYFQTIPFTDNFQKIRGITLKSSNKLPNQIILGLSKEENTILQNLITNNIKNPRFLLLNTSEDNTNFISSEGTTFLKYKIGIIAETLQGVLKLLLPDTDVIVYSIDRLVTFSSKYSQYIIDNEDRNLKGDREDINNFN